MCLPLPRLDQKVSFTTDCYFEYLSFTFETFWCVISKQLKFNCVCQVDGMRPRIGNSMKKLFEEDFEVRPDNEQQKRGFEVDLLVAQCDSQAKQNAKVKFWIFALENQDQHNFKIFFGGNQKNLRKPEKKTKETPRNNFPEVLVFEETKETSRKPTKKKIKRKIRGLVEGGVQPGVSEYVLLFCFFVYLEVFGAEPL